MLRRCGLYVGGPSWVAKDPAANARNVRKSVLTPEIYYITSHRGRGLQKGDSQSPRIVGADGYKANDSGHGA